MRCHGLTLLIPVLAIAAGCADNAVNQESQFDNQVEANWKQDFNWVDAEDFYKKHGTYADSGDPGDPEIDQKFVWPFLKRLEQDFQLDWQAVVDKKDATFAVAMVARLPDQPDVRQKIQDAIVNEEKTFPGSIEQSWGNRWVSLDFLNEEDAKFFEDDGTK